MTNKPAVPFINLNGTSRSELLQQQTDVMAACRNLLEALSRAAPHGRDYYNHVRTNAYATARNEHDIRTQTVKKILTDAEHIAERIVDLG